MTGQKENYNNELVSIIVPAYNVEKYIRECIRSLAEQTYKEIEIICIDDGSIDRTGEILDELRTGEDRLLVYHVINGGVGKARNEGIRQAKGKYIMLVDSDDYVESSMVEKLIHSIEHHHGDMSMCGYVEHFESGFIEHSFLEEGVYSCEEYLSHNIQAFLNSYFGGPICKLYRREIIEDNHLCYEENEILAEDFIFNTRSLRYLNTISVVNECLYHFRRYSEGSLSKQSHAWNVVYRRGHAMIEEYLATFKVRHVYDEHRRDLDNFYLRMLRFFISHLMVCNELSDGEKKTEFKKILNVEHEGLSLPDTYKNLELKNIIILFIYKHRMFRLAKMIYGNK